MSEIVFNIKEDPCKNCEYNYVFFSDYPCRVCGEYNAYARFKGGDI